MNLIDYATAGYDARMSERPPYDSSLAGRAFTCGEWARQNGILPREVSPGRGHKMLLNRDFVLDFKRNDHVPDVTRK